jgi:hypothetical protein
MEVFWFFFSKKNRKRFFLEKEAKTSSGLVAVASRRGAVIIAHDMMVDPFGNETARLVDRRFRVVNAVKGRAGTKGFQIPIAMNPELAIRGDDRTLTTASDGAELAPHPAKLLPIQFARDRPRSGLPQR